MRFTSALLALAAIPSILAIPAGTGSLDLSSSLVERDDSALPYANVTLEARHGGGGGGHGGGKDHCKKERGRGEDCQCFPGLGCHNDYDKCECGDQKNADFVFTGPRDTPRCECHGDDQHYNKREKKCFCDDGFKGTYKKNGKLQCTPECGKDQHYSPREKECVCDPNFDSFAKHGKLVCKPKCGEHQHRKNNECVCDDKFEASWKFGQLVCKPCKPTPVCGEHQHLNHKKECVCNTGYNPTYKKTDKHHKELVCVICPTPSKHPKDQHPKRSIEIGTPQPVEFKTVEDAIGCSAVEIACKIGSTWTCFDSSSNLASCGGCPGEGVDCSSIDSVDAVRCAKGQCVIDSCQRGYTVDAAAGICIPRGLRIQ